MSHRPKIVMRSPERHPITGLVEISVSLNESRPRGFAVEVQGAMGLDLSADVLEEICRRGGTFGLPGRIWANHSLSLWFEFYMDTLTFNDRSGFSKSCYKSFSLGHFVIVTCMGVIHFERHNPTELTSTQLHLNLPFPKQSSRLLLAAFWVRVREYENDTFLNRTALNACSTSSEKLMIRKLVSNSMISSYLSVN